MWKDAFLFQSREDVDPIDLNPSHHLLYEHVRDFRHKIRTMPDEVVIEIVRSIVCNEGGHIAPAEFPHIQEIFLNLKVKTIAGGQTIRKLIKSKPIQAKHFKKEPVKQIILHHFRQLGKERNQCTASFSIIRAGVKVGADLLVTMPHDPRPIIFLSGVKNQLIRILEIHPEFHPWRYVIFERNGNHININTQLLSSPEERAESLSTNLAGCFRHGVEYVEGSRGLTELFEHYKEGLSDLFEDAIALPPGDAAAEPAIHSLLTRYSHSEQALRLFLFLHMERILGAHLHTSDHIILNVHTKRDPCEHCIPTFFLETRMYNMNPAGNYIPPRPYGVFQKFNFPLSHASAGSIPSPYVLISSSLEGEETVDLSVRTSGEITAAPISPHDPVKVFVRRDPFH